MGTFAANTTESAAVEPNFDLSSFTPEQYSAWENKGTVPDAKPAESSPAPTESLAGAPQGDEPAAESAPASQEQPPKGKGAARNADDRIHELLRDRAELRARLEALEKPAAKTESAPAKPAESELKRPARPVFGEAGHENEEYAEFEVRQDAYVEALTEFKAKTTWQQTEAEKQKQAEESRRAEQAAEIDKTFNERLSGAKEKHADYAEVAFSAEVPITTVMDGFIRSHEAGAEVLYYLGGHVDEAKAIAAMSPYQAAFALSKIALSLEEPVSPETPPKEKAPVVPITKAARPATDIRATSAAPGDELRAAVEADDLERFEAIQNRKAVERRKGR